MTDALANRKFTDADRRRVKYVLANVIDEMDDSYDLQSMFGPFAGIVAEVITNESITSNLQDIVESERMETCQVCDCVKDCNGNPHVPGPDFTHEYRPKSEAELARAAADKSREVGLT